MKDKYYLISSKRSNSSYPRVEINYNHPMCNILIAENVELPDFELAIVKIDTHKLPRPTGTSYQKCREISFETYKKHFTLALSNLRNILWTDAEYYLSEESSTWFVLAMYTTDAKDKFSIIIDVRDSLEITSIDIHKSTNFSNRNSYRRKGKLISDEVFVACLRETIKYIDDSVSYHINIESYLSRMQEIIRGNYDLSSHNSVIDINQVIDQLNDKKTLLEKRLMQNDTDSPIDRATLRGEIEGLKYALNAIKVMRK
jgi:hypothetical protein